MREVLIIADDLTGAADCGAAFAAHGFKTVVVLDEPADAQDAEVVALDANTRAMSPAGSCGGDEAHCSRASGADRV